MSPISLGFSVAFNSAGEEKVSSPKLFLEVYGASVCGRSTYVVYRDTLSQSLVLCKYHTSSKPG